MGVHNPKTRDGTSCSHLPSLVPSFRSSGYVIVIQLIFFYKTKKNILIFHKFHSLKLYWHTLILLLFVRLKSHKFLSVIFFRPFLLAWDNEWTRTGRLLGIGGSNNSIPPLLQSDEAGKVSRSRSVIPPPTAATRGVKLAKSRERCITAVLAYPKVAILHRVPSVVSVRII